MLKNIGVNVWQGTFVMKSSPNGKVDVTLVVSPDMWEGCDNIFMSYSTPDFTTFFTGIAFQVISEMRDYIVSGSWDPIERDDYIVFLQEIENKVRCALS